MTESGEESLSERAQLLLKALIESYIRDGQPVGSRALSRDSGLSLSSATIRNVMADLEDLGFVASPHTSAGRIPTDKGYRLFVDSLLKLKPLQHEEVEDIERRLREATNGRSLLQTVSQMLSSVTHMAGLVTLPNPHYVALSQIEFIGLSENRALAIMVMNNGEVQNRVVQLDRRYSAEELRRAANYLNEAFAGHSLPDVRAILLRQLQETRQHMNQLMQDAIQVAQKVFESSKPEEQVEYVIAGETNLMGFAELGNVDRLRRLFEAFNEKHDILRLLDSCLRAQGIQIFIGQESGYQILDDISLVTAPYLLDNQVVGVLGIIGPTRMAYERVIPIVDVTAKLLGSALNARK
ncbi:MAG: heat-inducible transcriptional repressor HrcA [Steroidobacteraceae bacterium]|jgi:heat-inducible transcriptional repressor